MKSLVFGLAIALSTMFTSNAQAGDGPLVRLVRLPVHVASTVVASPGLLIERVANRQPVRSVMRGVASRKVVRCIFCRQPARKVARAVLYHPVKLLKR